MDVMRTWILSVTVAATVLSAAEALMPEGAVKKVGKLTGGLLLVLAILQPLVSLDYEELYDLASALPAGAVCQESLTQAALDPMKGIIEGELAAYIVDKGAELGLDCRAQVECAAGEDGVPVPQRVTVTVPFEGEVDQDLVRYITTDLGIPREHQVYIREETP